MKSSIIKRWAVSLLILIIAVTLVAQQAENNKNLPALDQWYSLMDSETNQRIGAKHLTIEKVKNTIVVNERLSIQDQNSTISYDAQIQYDTQPKLRPSWAKVVTYVDGEPFMTGMIDITPMSIELTSALVDENNQMIEPVIKDVYEFEQPTNLVFYQGLEYMAPEILNNRDQLSDVTFLIFPAEIDTIVELESNCSLVRQKDPDEKGSTYNIFSAYPRKQSICQWTMDQANEITEGTFLHAKMVKTTKQKALLPLDSNSILKKTGNEK